MNLLGRAGELRRLPAAWRTPLGRGYILLAAMSAAFGLSQFTSQAVTTNYFESVLHFTGPQFGYMTAIREIPGFLLIFITALLYRLSQQRLTALALVVMGIGLGGFVFATSFSTVIPWVLLSSVGFHLVYQTQYSLGHEPGGGVEERPRARDHGGRRAGGGARRHDGGPARLPDVAERLPRGLPRVRLHRPPRRGRHRRLSAPSRGQAHRRPDAAAARRVQARLPLLLRAQHARRRAAAALLLVRPVGPGEPLRPRGVRGVAGRHHLDRRGHGLLAVGRAHDRPPRRAAHALGDQRRLHRRARGLRAHEQRVARVRLLRHLRVHLAVLGDRRRPRTCARSPSPRTSLRAWRWGSPCCTPRRSSCPWRPA